MRLQLYVILNALALLGCRAYAAVPNLEGKAGNELWQAVVDGFTPSAYITEAVGTDGVWNLLLNADGGGDAFLNRFSAAVLPSGDIPSLPPLSVGVVNIAHPPWWEISHPYANALVQDLYNIFPAEIETALALDVYPPGVITGEVSRWGTVGLGKMIMAGYEGMVWEPADCYKGDVARVMMYMCTLYNQRLIPFGGVAHGYFSNIGYPVFSPSAARMFLVWHRNDPVDEYEKRRNRVFKDAQGNVNPFVEWPQLAEYLWGNMSGQPFGESADVGENPVDEAPLRGKYHLDDERINLHSPYVPANSVWRINGVEVSQPYLEPAQIGVGTFLLEFTSAECHGKITICVEN